MKVVGCKRFDRRGPGGAGGATAGAASVAAASRLAVAAWAGVLACSASALLTAGCGAGVSPGSPAVAPGASGVTVDGASAPGGFSVFAEQSAAGDYLGQSKLALSVAEAPGGVVVAVEVRDTRSLKAVLAGLHYDASRWHPDSAEFTQALGEGGRLQGTGDREQVGAASSRPLPTAYCLPPTAPDVLSLAILTDPGVVHLAQALAHYDAQPGLTADHAVVARVRFSPGALRHASSAGPPRDPRSKPGVFWDLGASTPSWHYANKGDGDLNGVVNLADIIALAQHFGESYDTTDWLWGGKPTYRFGSNRLWNIDGDDNLHINLADVTFIASHFRSSALGGYDVFASTDPADCPATPDAPNGSGAQRVAHLDFAEAVKADFIFPELAPGLRNMLFKPEIAIVPGYCYWVRPMAEYASYGTPSTIAYSNDLQVLFQGPTHVSNQPVLTWSASMQNLEWYYRNSGDYDQSGVVVYRDKEMVARNFGATSPSGHYPESTSMSVVDGNDNGVVGLDDVTTLGEYYASALTGYNVYASADIADYDACASGPSVIMPIGHVAFSAAQGDPGVDRLHFSFHLGSPDAGCYYWVRPELWGTEGIESQALQLPAS